MVLILSRVGLVYVQKFRLQTALKSWFPKVGLYHLKPTHLVFKILSL